MAKREQLHAEIDALPEDQLATARVVVEGSQNGTDRQRSEIDAAIIDSYTQVPQEDLGASWAARQSILEEPWDLAT